MDEAALREAVKALETTPDESFKVLPGRLKEIARTGKRTKIQFNHLGIRYLVLDEFGILSLRWLVSNGITGRQETYYTKDYMTKEGKVRWKYLASKIYNT